VVFKAKTEHPERLALKIEKALIGTPAYASMTIRNWNTTTRLLALMEAAQA
jgi:uncharacterized protein (DUF1697 family)